MKCHKVIHPSTCEARKGAGVPRLLSYLLLFVVVFSSEPGKADYIPFDGSEVAPNIAEIRVDQQGISIQLEVLLDDIPDFELLVPDNWFKKPIADRAGQSVRLEEFAENGLSVRRADGRALPVTVRAVEARLRIDRTNPMSGQIDPVTGRRFPMPPADQRVLFVHLFYAFDKDRPDVVTISPPMTNEDLPLATIGMIVFDRGLPVTNFSYLSAPATLTIDWEDPWFSRFDNPNLKRHHQSGVTTFIYVEPREVRHETLIRLRELDPWLSLNLSSGDSLSSETQERIKQSAAEFLARRNPVRIDGVRLMPETVLAVLLKLDASGLQVLDDDAPLSADTAFLGVILSFPIIDLPDTVDITWDMFNSRIVKVPATATDMVGPFLSGASPEDPVITWTNHLLNYDNPQTRDVIAPAAFVVPLISVLGVFVALCAALAALQKNGIQRTAAIGFAVASLVTSVVWQDKALVPVRNPFDAVPPDAAAKAAFADLLANIRVAHLETSPDARAKELSVIATEDSLVDIAAELERALAIRVPGGGLARIAELRDISLQNIQPIAAGYGFRALAEWSVVASAGHWGHSHVRGVHYRALVEVVEDEGTWKLDGITVLETRTPNA